MGTSLNFAPEMNVSIASARPVPMALTLQSRQHYPQVPPGQLRFRDFITQAHSRWTVALRGRPSLSVSNPQQLSTTLCVCSFLPSISPPATELFIEFQMPFASWTRRGTRELSDQFTLKSYLVFTKRKCPKKWSTCECWHLERLTLKGTHLPWLAWLSGLRVGLWTKGSPVWFPVRAHAWVAGQVPSRGCMRGNCTVMFLSLSFSLPSPPSTNK